MMDLDEIFYTVVIMIISILFTALVIWGFIWGLDFYIHHLPWPNIGD